MIMPALSITPLVGFFWIFIAFFIGCVLGIIWRNTGYWLRDGVYVKNDEYRVGFLIGTSFLAIYVMRQIEVFTVNHHWMYDGPWPLCWSLFLTIGISSGFKRSFRFSAKTEPVQQMPDE